MHVMYREKHNAKITPTNDSVLSEPSADSWSSIWVTISDIRHLFRTLPVSFANTQKRGTRSTTKKEPDNSCSWNQRLDDDTRSRLREVLVGESGNRTRRTLGFRSRRRRERIGDTLRSEEPSDRMGWFVGVSSGFISSFLLCGMGWMSYGQIHSHIFFPVHVWNG